MGDRKSFARLHLRERIRDRSLVLQDRRGEASKMWRAAPRFAQRRAEQFAQFRNIGTGIQPACTGDEELFRLWRRPEHERLAKRRHRAERIALHRIREREANHRLAEIGLQHESPAIVPQRGLDLTAREQHSGKIVERLRIVGPQRNRPLKRPDRLVGTTALGQEICKVEMGLGQIRREADHPFVGCLRLGQSAKRLEAVAEIEVRFNISRLQFDGALVVRDDGRELSELGQRKAKMIMRLRIALLPRQRAPDQVGRGFRAPLLQQQETEVMQSWGMIGIPRQEVAVGRFGLAKAPLLMEIHRRGETRLGALLRCRFGQSIIHQDAKNRHQALERDDLRLSIWP